MPLIRNSYGKARVRIMRVRRGERQDVRELSVNVILSGAFADSYTSSDNSAAIATDSIKNVVNLVAHEQLEADKEDFAAAIAAYFLKHYPQVDAVEVMARETKWARLAIDGVPHEHSFLLDSNGKPFVRLAADRHGVATISGIEGFTFLKTTASGWVGYVMDEVTTLPETTDRILATSMDASWRWSTAPASYSAANDAILTAALKLFATTYSPSVQNTMYRMGEAALAAVPEISEISMACPNKHYLPIDLSRIGGKNDNRVFTPTDEPSGQIECTVGRG